MIGLLLRVGVVLLCITGLLLASALAFGVYLSDNPVLVYTRNDNGTRGRIYLTDMQTQLTFALTSAEHDSSQPVWSPDGSQIIFRSDMRDADGVRQRHYIMDADGRNVRPLAPGLVEIGGVIDLPLWSPDGTQVALRIRPAGARDLQFYVLDVASGEITHLTNSKYIFSTTAWQWTPDSSRLRWVEILLDEFDAWEVPVDPPAEATRLHLWDTDFGGTLLYPIFSGDASQFMTYSRVSADAAYTFQRFDIADGSIDAWQTETSIGSRLPSLAWAPDDAQVVFTGYDDALGQDVLYLADRNGEQVRALLGFQEQGVYQVVTVRPAAFSGGYWVGFRAGDAPPNATGDYCVIHTTQPLDAVRCITNAVHVSFQP